MPCSKTYKAEVYADPTSNRVCTTATKDVQFMDVSSIAFNAPLLKNINFVVKEEPFARRR